MTVRTKARGVCCTLMIAASLGGCKSAAPAPDALEVRGGESREVILFRSRDTALAECRDSSVVMSHLTTLFAAVGCPEQNHTTAGRQRYVCEKGSFLITPREKPDGAGFDISLQVTGDVSAPRKALADSKEAAWLIHCGVKFPPSPVAAPTLWSYGHESGCWNDSTCPAYCRETSKFLAAAGKAATTYGCTVNEDESRILFTCKKPSKHPGCALNLDGEVSALFLPERDEPERDEQHHRAFTITYRGNAVEACPGTSFQPAGSEEKFFGVGFPNFLLQLRNDCRPRTP